MIPIGDHNPTRNAIFINGLLLLANIAVFVFELSMGDARLAAFINTWGVRSTEVMALLGGNFELLTPVLLKSTVSMFLHGGWSHIIFNMLFLWIFAQWTYPELAFACILVIAFLLGSIFIPIRVPGYGNLTLLDRPFVEMILYLPLSLLGGLGLAGMEQHLKQVASKWETPHSLPVGSARVLFMGAVLANALAGYNLYPADCCSIVGRDDLVAMDWMAKNLPPEARILISSTELRVLATNRRLLVWFEGAWASVWYDGIRELHPDLEQHRVTMLFDDDPPYALAGP